MERRQSGRAGFRPRRTARQACSAAALFSPSVAKASARYSASVSGVRLARPFAASSPTKAVAMAMEAAANSTAARRRLA